MVRFSSLIFFDLFANSEKLCNHPVANIGNESVTQKNIHYPLFNIQFSTKLTDRL